MTATFLGIDLGTSGVKAVLIDEGQKVAATASAALAVSRPHPGWSEQDPAEWIRATGIAIDRLATRRPEALAAVRGIGLSGQMHGATLLDASDRALRPCILWNDTRAHREAAELDAMPEFRRISGNIVFPGFTAPKLVWVRRNEPEIFERTRKVLLPKDFLRLWLTGESLSDMSDSSGTAWFDTGRRDWSGTLLDRGGMSRAQMPGLVEGTAPAGRLRPELAARWGIKGEPTVAGGAGDNAASAIGLGVVMPGAAFVSLGTSGVLFAATDRYRPRPESAVHAFCHAFPDTWHQMGVILSAADALEWHAGICGSTANELSAGLGESLVAPCGTVFLPYLSGERTPHNDPGIRGAFVGLSRSTDRAAMTRAVLEGVAFALRDSLEALAAAGARPARLIAAGGGSRSRYWMKLVATVLGLPVDLPADGEHGAAFGAARLGLIAATGAEPESVCPPPPILVSLEPEAALRPAFEDKWHRFRSLYPLLSGVCE